MQEMQVQSLDQEDPLEEEVATHSSSLAWEISWTGEPSRRVRHDLATKQEQQLKAHVFLSITWSS